MNRLKSTFMASLAALMALTACNSTSNGGGSVAAGGQAIEIKDGKFTPEVLLSLGRVGDPQVSPDGTRLLFSVNYQDVKENKGNADLWLMDIDGKTPPVNITNTPSSESNAVWINEGAMIAFLYRDPAKEDSKTQVWVMNADGSSRKPVSEMENGVEGFVVSPDGTKILLISTVQYGKTQPLDNYPDLDKANARLIDDMMYKHWDEWVTQVPHPYIADFTGNVVKDPKDILEGTEYESPMRPWGGVESFAWTPDSKKVIYTCRKKTGKEYAFSTNSDLYLYDIESGKEENLTEGMMGYDTNPRIFKDKVAFLSMEHDGYEADKNRIFVMDLKTREKKDLTENWDYSADDIAWSADGKSIYFVAPYMGTIPMFRIDVETQKIDTISPVNREEADNKYYDFTGIVPLKDGKVITMRHNFAEPNEIYCMEMGKEPVQLTHVNDAILKQLKPITIKKEIVPTTDGKEMTVWVVLPPNFDPNKKYPSLFFCEGGPQSPVSQFFSYRWNFRLMASQDYVVIAPNRRGLPGFGTEWNAQISGDYGGQNMKDYMSAAEYMKQQPYIDGSRMGAVGASYGGYSVYWLAGNHNNTFACFLAHAGIFNLEAQYLETEELWFTQWDLGGPCWEKDNAVAQKTYSQANPKNFVQNWNTPIMITAGELDYRIVFTQACQAFDAAQILGIPSRMLLFPEENHWILKPQNSLMWQREFFRWFDTWLKPESEASKAYIAQHDSIAKIKAVETKGAPTPMPKKQESLNITNASIKAALDKAKTAPAQAAQDAEAPASK